MAVITLPASADNAMPGKGVTVQPLKGPLAEETFQTRIVMRALADLGYDVKPVKESDYASAHLAVATEAGAFLTTHWTPLHNDFYASNGGDAKLVRSGALIANNLQGYLIDRKTAEQYRITNIAQLRDPAVAKLFDTDGDGKADLAGCAAGWGCEKVIEHQLTAYKLRDTITHKQGAYSELMADVITRYKEGKPILYYTWTPYWVSGTLVPNTDVVWLEVPFSSQPGVNAGKSTKLPNGKDYGFEVNTQHILASKAFVTAHPDAGKLFEVMTIDVNDINMQNMWMSIGLTSSADIDRHVTAWIKVNRKVYDGWLAQAQAAANP
ncbi:glycine betaine/L-proline ABC transporter substrate-binding protein ProX [Denitromonas sp. IR12]|uniref:Glycine betaine/L-proline ABC transporter substrate-binding protein ProX n=2 Tax=Denitromonas iodatirespirans TaxID=2795389 RepID=A0A944DCV2_DENI1|nr:glycine betaine/L-proline ABC transporter substrate-binding protein ProX [Denitromonas iodatirespirans]